MSIDRQKVVDWLNKEWKGEKRCPICSSNKWSISDMTFELRQFLNGSLDLGKPVMPLVPISCGTCAHVILFNAVLLGVVQAAPSDETNENHGLEAK